MNKKIVVPHSHCCIKREPKRVNEFTTAVARSPQRTVIAQKIAIRVMYVILVVQIYAGKHFPVKVWI